MPNPPLPTPEQLEAWSALCEQATSGEWTHETSVRLSSIGVVRPHFWTGQTPDNVHHFVHFRDATHHANAAADAEFIATARTALPTLLAAYRALREETLRVGELWLAELSRISVAIGSTEFMDPPDGGSVELSEQVARMRAELDRVRAENERLKADRAFLVADNEWLRELSDGGPSPRATEAL